MDRLISSGTADTTEARSPRSGNGLGEMRRPSVRKEAPGIRVPLHAYAPGERRFALSISAGV